VELVYEDPEGLGRQTVRRLRWVVFRVETAWDVRGEKDWDRIYMRVIE